MGRIKYGWLLAFILPWPEAFAVEVRLVPKAQGEEGLNLNQAMDQAVEKSPLREASRAAERAATARKDQSGEGMGPHLDLEANRAWVDTDVNKLAGKVLPNGTRIPDQVSNAALTLSQPLTDIWTQKRRKDADQHMEEAARAEVETQTQTVRSRTAEAYIQVLKAARRLAISQESQTLIEQQKKDASLQQKQGRLAVLDFQRFELAAAEATTVTSDAAASLEAAVISLQELIGVAPRAVWVLEDLETPPAPPAVNPKQERPELAGAGARIAAAQSSQSAAEMDYWPKVQAFARVQRDFAAKDIEIPLPGFESTYPKEDYRDNFSYGLSLNWRLWDNLSRLAHNRELSALVEKAENEKAGLASSVRVEQAQANAEWQRVEERLRSAIVASDLSDKIYRSFESKFKNGLAMTTDMLGAERDRTRSHSLLADARYDVQLAAVRLRRAYGERP